MPTQLLTPFKANFILEVKTTMKGFFKNPQEVSLEQKYSKIKDSSGNVDFHEFIKYYHFSFSEYNDFKILQLKFHQPLNVSPEGTTIDETRDLPFHFSLESFDVEVLQIIDNKITFANSSKEVHTVETNERLKLIKK